MAAGMHPPPRRRPAARRLWLEGLLLLSLVLYAASMARMLRLGRGKPGNARPEKAARGKRTPAAAALDAQGPPKPKHARRSAKPKTKAPTAAAACRFVPVPPLVRFSGTAARGYDRDVVVRTKPGAHSSVAGVDRRWITRGVTKYAHMVTLALDGGDASQRTVYAAWQASDKNEGASDQHIRLARSRDGGVKWGKSWAVAEGDGYPLWGPVLHADGPKLWLFYSASTHNCTVPNREDWRSPGGDLVATYSEDGGKTWSTPRTILRSRDVNADARPHGHAPAPLVTANSVAETGAGGGDSAWLLPFWSESRARCGGGSGDPMDEAHALISHDRGATWHMSEEGVAAPLTSNATWLIENTIAPLQGGVRLLQMFRTKAGCIFASWSRDEGATWSEAEAVTELLNPDSKVHALRLPGSSDVVVAYNHNSVPGRRTPLYLARGSGARHGRWQTPVAVLEDDRYTDFSYPTSIARRFETAEASARGEEAGRASLPGLTEVLTAYTVAPSDGHIPTSYRGLRVASTVLGAPLVRAVRGKVAVRGGSLRIPLGTGACASLASPGVPFSLHSARPKAFKVRLSLRVSATRQFLEACADATPRGELRLLELRGERGDMWEDVGSANETAASGEGGIVSQAVVSFVCVRGDATNAAADEPTAKDGDEPAWNDDAPTAPTLGRRAEGVHLGIRLRSFDGKRVEKDGEAEGGDTESDAVGRRLVAMVDADDEHVLAVSVYPQRDPGHFVWTLHLDARFVGRAEWRGGPASEARMGCARGPSGLGKLNLGDSAVEVREIEVSEIARYKAECSTLAFDDEQSTDTEERSVE